MDENNVILNREHCQSNISGHKRQRCKAGSGRFAKKELGILEF